MICVRHDGPEAELAATPEAAAEAPCRPLILAADDQPENLFVLQDLLGESYEVRTVADGASVLDFLAGGRLPDILLLDVLMPGVDGFETCRRIKQNPATRDLPVIFLTSLDTTQAETQGLELGAEDFIHKPFVPGVVLARVRNLLGRHQIERQRQELAVLEAQMAEQRRLAATLQAAIDKITVMNQELERFTVVAAHDLREPARAACLHAQVLRKGFAHRLEDSGLRHLSFIETAARRMYDIVGGLLSYSEAGSSERRNRPVSAAAACSLALANLRPQITQADAEIIVGPLPEVIADEQMLVRLLQNLIENAVKFRDRKRRLRIKIEATSAPDGWQISVVDNGLGFAAGSEDVFEVFRRLRQGDETGGIGFGLAICKRIVQHWNGKIWAVSTPGFGSSFTFTIPANDPGSELPTM